MIRPANPYVITPDKMPRFQGMRGKRVRVVEMRDSEGRDISPAFANWQCDLDSTMATGMRRRCGKRKHETTGYAADVQWIGGIRLRGQMMLAFQTGTYLKMEVDYSIPSVSWPPDGNSDPAAEVGLPDFFAVSDGENDCIIYCSPDWTTWDVLGTTGTGVNQFTGPRHCWYDKADAMFYVADAGNSRVVKTQIDGTGWASLTSIAGTDLIYPYGCYHDHDSGFTYISDRDVKAVFKTKWDGGVSDDKFTTYTVGGVANNFVQPRGIQYVAATGKLYLVAKGSSATGTIVECDWDGLNAVSLGTKGAGNLQFASPRSVYYDTTTSFIYVSDRDNNRVVRTKMDGSSWAVLGGFSEPRGVFYDETSKYCFTADTNANVIHRESIYGQGMLRLGQYGASTTAGCFSEPRYVQPIWT